MIFRRIKFNIPVGIVFQNKGSLGCLQRILLQGQRYAVNGIHLIKNRCIIIAAAGQQQCQNCKQCKNSFFHVMSIPFLSVSLSDKKYSISFRRSTSQNPVFGVSFMRHIF